MESFLLKANPYSSFPQSVIKAELLINSKVFFYKKLIKRMKTFVVFSTMYSVLIICLQISKINYFLAWIYRAESIQMNKEAANSY